MTVLVIPKLQMNMTFMCRVGYCFGSGSACGSCNVCCHLWGLGLEEQARTGREWWRGRSKVLQVFDLSPLQLIEAVALADLFWLCSVVTGGKCCSGLTIKRMKPACRKVAMVGQTSLMAAAMLSSL